MLSKRKGTRITKARYAGWWRQFSLWRVHKLGAVEHGVQYGTGREVRAHLLSLALTAAATVRLLPPMNGVPCRQQPRPFSLARRCGYHP